MNLHLQPRQFLFIYNALKRLDKEYDFVGSEDADVFDSTKALFEGTILEAFEDIEMKALSTGFDKWVKSETNKIKGLEDELKKIKETVPQEALANKFFPVKKDTTAKPGRPRKKK